MSLYGLVLQLVRSEQHEVDAVERRTAEDVWRGGEAAQCQSSAHAKAHDANLGRALRLEVCLSASERREGVIEAVIVKQNQTRLAPRPR